MRKRGDYAKGFPLDIRTPKFPIETKLAEIMLFIGIVGAALYK